jgi:hypothetical protein
MKERLSQILKRDNINNTIKYRKETTSTTQLKIYFTVHQHHYFLLEEERIPCVTDGSPEKIR